MVAIRPAPRSAVMCSDADAGLIPASRATPLVTVLDGHPHTLAFLATINRVPHAPLGVAQFGQSGSIEDLYRDNGIDTDSIIRAALDLASS